MHKADEVSPWSRGPLLHRGGEAVALPFGRTGGFKPRVRYNLIREYAITRLTSMLRLGINVDHVATVRQARRIDIPDPVEAALMAEKGGADGITVHLREDRRHIQERDVKLLRQKVMK